MLTLQYSKQFFLLCLGVVFSLFVQAGQLTGITPELTALELISAVPVNGPNNLQPSGLSYCNGHLLMVSDRYPQTIFQLTDNNQHYQAKPFLQLSYIEIPKTNFLKTLIARMFSFVGKKFDWEGIACDQTGTLYLGSERWNKILQVINPHKKTWLDIPIDSHGKNLGLFAHYNAKLEGIAFISENELIITAERQPRGILHFQRSNATWHLKNGKVIPTTHYSSHRPSSDFSDILYDNNKLYTLERSASIICRRTMRSFEVEQCWSYAQITRIPRFQYESTRQGLAEGLTRINHHLFIIFDNNNTERTYSPRDRRSLLFQFKVPSNWSE